MSRTHTHTYAILEIGDPAYQEIAANLRRAGYGHAFHEDDGRIVIDMQGIAIASNGTRPKLMHPEHWVMAPGETPEPSRMPAPIDRERVRDAVREAIRACTLNGTELDFDPDAMVIEIQNRLLGFQPNLGCRAMGAAVDPNSKRAEDEAE